MTLYAHWQEVQYTLTIGVTSDKPSSQFDTDAFFDTGTNILHYGKDLTAFSLEETKPWEANTDSLLTVLGIGNKITILDGVVTSMELNQMALNAPTGYDFTGIDLTRIKMITVSLDGLGANLLLGESLDFYLSDSESFIIKLPLIKSYDDDVIVTVLTSGNFVIITIKIDNGKNITGITIQYP